MPDAMRESATPASNSAVATLAHLGVKSAHRPHAAAVRELACAALSMLRSATAHTPSLHRVLLVGALGDDRVLNSTTPTGAAESLWSERLRSALALEASTLKGVRALQHGRLLRFTPHASAGGGGTSAGKWLG